MMRLFGPDCLDVSELNSDGWVVSYNLIGSILKEDCAMAETSLQWFFNQKQTDTLFAFSASTIWYGVQQAVRAFLAEEHSRAIAHNLLFQKATGGVKGKSNDAYWSHASAIGYWLALRASGRHMLPLVLQAGQFLQVAGFDALPGDGASPRDLNRAISVICSTWTKLSPQILSQASALIERELEYLLDEIKMDRKTFSVCLQPPPKHDMAIPEKRCIQCNDDYTALGRGLVQPRRISFLECRATGHKYYCECAGYLHAQGGSRARSAAELGDVNEEDVEDELSKEPELDIDELCRSFDTMSLGDSGTVEEDPFAEAATILYRVQGRRWTGAYEPDEVVCATCFLIREDYIGEGGPSDHAGVTPVPETFVSAYPPSILEAAYAV